MDKAKLIRITITIDRGVLAQLDRYATQHRWSRSTAAAAIIEDAVTSQDQDQAAS